MPTFDKNASFIRDWEKLTDRQRAIFRLAIAAFVTDLPAGTGFRKGLRVKKMSGMTMSGR